VPTLIIPLFSDQPINARLMAKQGLGYFLPFPRATPEAIRERLQALLQDQALHERVKQTAREIRDASPKQQVLETIERLSLGSAQRAQAKAAA
jgi:UDP:flavonoid glycosyltransferase YjiC (YdhE family)